MKERLQKIIARAGICSRRKAEEYIKQGRVSVDGNKVIEQGVKVDPERQAIKVDNKKIVLSEHKIYLLLNKPRGYVTTLNDPQKRPIVSSLLKKIPERVFPVGRLDLDTEGALLLTNDGDFANHVLHPRYEIKKTYIAKVQGRIAQSKINILQSGIELEGKKTWPAKINIIKSYSAETTVKIVIHEGRKRQVRKMFAAVEHPVIHLQRVAYGGLKLGSLELGEYRLLTSKDLNKIIANKKNLYKK